MFNYKDFFEKLKLKRIQNIETLNNSDLTSKNQHGLKKKVHLLSVKIAINDIYVLMANIDFSSAFEVVNIDLLVERV